MSRTRQGGFLVIAAIFLLVVVAAYVGYVTTQSNVQQLTTLADLQSARALQAARAGIEWGAFQVIRNSSCSNTTLTFAGTSLAEFSTAVTCSSAGPLTEGASSITTYQVTANACNSPPCPSAAATATYAERQLTVSIAK